MGVDAMKKKGEGMSKQKEINLLREFQDMFVKAYREVWKEFPDISPEQHYCLALSRAIAAAPLPKKRRP